MPPAFDLFAPDVLADPYPLYHALRSAAPVWRGPQGQWVVTRFADVSAALHDPRFAAAAINPDHALAFPEPLRPAVAAMLRPLRTFMVAQDPPEHTRLRGRVSKSFTPHVVEALRPRVEARVDALLSAVAGRADPATGSGRAEMIHDFAFALPVTVVGILLGLPDADHDRFREWAYDLSVLWSPPGVRDVETRVRRCQDSFAALTAYFQKVIADRRARPTDDLVSALLGPHGSDAPLTDEEVIWNCVLLLLAGHETVTDLIGNGLLALMRFPDQWQALRADPALVPGAVEELLRYDAPFQFMQRVAREDLTLGGTSIAKGERLWLMLGAANRDPEAFSEPDRLDVTRGHSHQIAFGAGVHFCVGAPLARLEGRLAFGALVRRFAEFRLAAEPLEWLPKIPNRGLKALPVTFRVDPATQRA